MLLEGLLRAFVFVVGLFIELLMAGGGFVLLLFILIIILS